MEKYMQVLSTTSEITEAPEYIKVFPHGYISSMKGDFIVDDESFRLMKEHMQRRKLDIVIDYEHQTLSDVQAPASGWIKDLILKSDGIFARVEWTLPAKQYLAKKEYRYLSPVVLVRKSDHKAIQLHSVALTNTPAIDGMTPIVNSIDLPTEAFHGLEPTKKHILKMLNLSEDDYRRYGR